MPGETLLHLSLPTHGALHKGDQCLLGKWHPPLSMTTCSKMTGIIVLAVGLIPVGFRSGHVQPFKDAAYMKLGGDWTRNLHRYSSILLTLPRGA